MLLHQKSEEVEAALWSSLRLLKEKATLTRQLAMRSRVRGNGKNTGLKTDRLEEQAGLEEQHARMIEELLQSMPRPLDQGEAVKAMLE